VARLSFETNDEQSCDISSQCFVAPTSYFVMLIRARDRDRHRARRRARITSTYYEHEHELRSTK